MTKQIKLKVFTEELEDIESFTGLTSDELLEADVDLDDWDICLIVDGWITEEQKGIYGWQRLFYSWESSCGHKEYRIRDKYGERITLVLTYHA